MRSLIASTIVTLAFSLSTGASAFAQKADMLKASPAPTPAKAATAAVTASLADTTKSKTEKKAEKKAEQKTDKLEKKAENAENKADQAQRQADNAVMKAETKKDKAVKAADKAAGEVTAPVAAMDDAGIATAIKEKLASLPSLKDTKIDVVVKGGVATLTGNVKNAGLKGVATNAAKRIAGVKQVDNQIVAEKGIKK
jgi:osmotically-inducible protein OsmY